MPDLPFIANWGRAIAFLMTVECLVASAAYGLQKDWRHCIYFFIAAAANITVAY